MEKCPLCGSAQVEVQKYHEDDFTRFRFACRAVWDRHIYDTNSFYRTCGGKRVY